MVFDAAWWAFVALVLFIALVIYLKLPGMITGLLDKRIAKIQEDLNEAERLRAEAKALLDSYARKRQEAEKEAEGIVLAAREEAFRMTADASAALDALIVRRTKAVEDKIAQAEASAVAEVRARSADLAVEAARTLLRQQMPSKGPQLVDQAIQDVAAKLN
jgi:F-type H+-transporting ATPase subunit b